MNKSDTDVEFEILLIASAIKEEIDNSVYFIHAEKFDKNFLKSITITETNKYYEIKDTIIAEKGDIASKNWYLNNVTVIDINGSKNKLTLKHYPKKSNIILNEFENLNDEFNTAA